MNARWKLAAAVLGMATLAACSKSDDTTANAPADKPVAPSVDSAKDAMSNAAANAKTAAGNAMSNAKDSMSNMVAGAKDKLAGAQDQAADSSHPIAQANLDKVTQLIADKKYDAADMALKPVEANKSKLPQDMQDRIAALRTQITAAKAGM